MPTSLTSPLHLSTPLVPSRALGLHCGRSVWLKLDALQPSGSFKLRGIGRACEEYGRRGARRFVSSSGGNAGIAVAYAGRCLSIPVTVVVPETTSVRARELLRQEGAELLVQGASWQEANTHAQSLLTPADAFIHPFDDPLIWQGHATLVEELAQEGFKPGAVVLSVGGGGLLAGVVAGLKNQGWQDVPVIAVETEGADSYRQSLKAGERIRLERISSLATSLGAKQVCEQAFQLAREHTIHSEVVSDRAAITACLRFLDDHRLLVEPACGASLALAYKQAPVLQQYDDILFIVCGGATASAAQMCQWLEDYAEPGRISPYSPYPCPGFH